MEESKEKWNTDLMTNRQFFTLVMWSIFLPSKYEKFKRNCEDGLIGKYAFEKEMKEKENNAFHDGLKAGFDHYKES